jgi:hypothetical protein
MVLTSELAYVTSAVPRVGVLFPQKIKFKLKEFHKAFFFFNWSAIESGPTYIAIPITGGRCVGGVTLDDRRVEVQGVFKNLLSDKRWNAKEPLWMAELKFMFI